MSTILFGELSQCPHPSANSVDRQWASRLRGGFCAMGLRYGQCLLEDSYLIGTRGFCKRQGCQEEIDLSPNISIKQRLSSLGCLLII
ncbi:hypothetical protein CEXT_247711 [Caerostris extrusa]|uniref:Uncharacterized protein n=1 Tax=Caerostris extrusa TaxID=172846 RepID=A0AAV4MRG5_CAEEX|nr:hypothetical protein CEXT_247711 [Caerostris extrusa]